MSSPAAASGAVSFSRVADLDDETARRVAELAEEARPTWRWLVAGIAVLWVVLFTLDAPSVTATPRDATRLAVVAFVLGALPPVAGFMRAHRRFAAGCRVLGLADAAIVEARRVGARTSRARPVITSLDAR